MSAELDAALADHRVFTHAEALTLAQAVSIMEKHAEGIRKGGTHPDRGEAADVILKIAGGVGYMLQTAIMTGMVAPRGYVPGNLS